MARDGSTIDDCGVRRRSSPAVYTIQPPTYLGYLVKDKPTLNPGETLADPPVRCPDCRGRISVVPCRLCRLRRGERFDRQAPDPRLQAPGRPSKADVLAALCGLHGVGIAQMDPDGQDPDDDIDDDFETPPNTP